MNILEDLKALRKLPFTKTALQKYIIEIMENFFYSMFDYKKFPDSMPKEMAERYLIWQGRCGADRVPEKYNTGMYKGEAVFLNASVAGGTEGESMEALDVYGLGTDVILTGANGYTITKGINEAAVGFNNSAHTSLRSFIVLTSDAIANALTAVRSGVAYSKNHPIYKARDNKEKAALNEYWKKVKDGDGDDDLAIASDNIDFVDAINGAATAAQNNVINLSDPVNADKMQYVVKVVDDYMRWACGLYGQAIQGNGKMAQQTVDEVNGQTSFSFVLPNDMLYQRRLWCERMKKLGLVPEDAEIDFSAAFKVEEVKYQKEADINENGQIEEVTEQVEEPEEEPEQKPEEEPEKEEGEDNE